MSLFTISSNEISSTTAYIGEVFNDIKPLFFLIIGLMLGFWILSVLLNIFNKKER